MAATSKPRREKGGHHRRANGTARRGQWLGAGAVAVAMGAAMATGHGVAGADPGAADSSTSSDAGSSNTTSSSDAGSDESSSSSDSTTSDASGGSSQPDYGPTSKVSAQTTGSDESSSSSDSTSADASGGSSQPDSGSASEVTPETTEDGESEQEPIGATTPSSGAGESESTSVTDEAGQSAETSTDAHDDDGRTGADSAISDSGTDADKSSTVLAAVSESSAIPTTTNQDESISAATISGQSANGIEEPSAAVTSGQETSGTAVSAASVLTPAAGAPAPAPVAAATAPVSVFSLISGVLAGLGFAPNVNTPVPTNPLISPLELLGAALRRIQYTFFNQQPTAHPTTTAQNLTTGVVTGKLKATDADGDTLTYTVHTAPEFGSVSVDAAGNFTYTPTAAAAGLGVQDSFVIAIDDRPGNPPHVHGLLGLLGFDRSTTNTTVAVSVSPIVPQTELERLPYTVLVNEPDGAAGYVFLTRGLDLGALAAALSNPSEGPLPELEIPPGFLEITDKSGQPVWIHSLPEGHAAVNFQVQEYQGEPVLTWSQCSGLSSCSHYIANDRYEVIAEVTLDGDLHIDPHEFRLTPDGHALMIGSERVPADLTAVGGPADGMVLNTVALVVDPATNEVVAKWDPQAHISIEDSFEEYTGMVLPPLLDGSFDAFHMNSVDLGPNGDLLISLRNTSAIYSVNPYTGEINWQLGGKHPTLTAGPGVQFAFQHDAQFVDADTIRLFNNNNNLPTGTNPSSFEVIDIDLDTNTATLVSNQTHPDNLAAWATGSAQGLPNGNMIGSWGTTGHISELTPDGQLVYDVQLPEPSYRAVLEQWHGDPQQDPELTVSSTGAPTVHAVWNGATEVRHWRLLFGTEQTNLAPIATVEWNSLNTAIPLPAGSSMTGYFQIEALDDSGAVIGRSSLTQI